MAIQMDITDKGITHTNAYLRIEKMVGIKPNFSVYIRAYTDSTCDTFICNVKNESMNSNLFGVSIDASGGSYHDQAYTQIKQLDQFAGATDV